MASRLPELGIQRVERVTVVGVTGIEPALSAWEVCGAVVPLPAD